MRIYIETYGCRMNICDSEVILSILSKDGHTYCADIYRSDVIILNCCSVREVGHEKTFERLAEIAKSGLEDKMIVVAGCLATQLDKTIFDKFPHADIVAGPDTYRKLPTFIRAGKGLHVILGNDDPKEMYEDIIPKRYLEDSTTAAITIMKGCNQFCSYCIEPYTRGRELSRDVESILSECKRVETAGYKELTFVGHIIDRYRYGFAELLDRAATLCPGLRIKYLSSHPLTYTDETLDVVRRHENIMRVVHLPVQSGSDKILKRMNRGYTIDQYKRRYSSIKESMPDMRIVTDIMVGFCGETDEDFRQTADLVRELEFDDINVFCFSLRQGTAAEKKYKDDVPEDIKNSRKQAILSLRDEIKQKKHTGLIGKEVSVINEGRWYNDQAYSFGRDKYLNIYIFKSDNDIPVNEEVRLIVQSAAPDYLIGTSI